MLKRFVYAALFVVTSIASARVVSYAPYTNRSAYPLQQPREDRYFALYELSSPSDGQLVLYDSSGAEEPRVIFPTNGSSAYIFAGIVRERNGIPTILIEATVNGASQATWYFSSDGGRNWTTPDLPLSWFGQLQGTTPDVGGPFVNSRFSQMRFGTDAFPFVVGIPNGNLYSVDAIGGVRKLFTNATGESLSLAGQNPYGTAFLLRYPPTKLSIVDLNGNVTPSATVSQAAFVEGWITPDNAVYIDQKTFSSTFDHRIVRYTGTTGKTLAQNFISSETLGVFAVPTYDFSGAWIIKRGGGAATILYRQSGNADPVEQWSDVTAPEVEALHAGASGNTLLIQVHRPRAVDTSTRFLDPAIAIWHTGEGAPRGVRRAVHERTDLEAVRPPRRRQDRRRRAVRLRLRRAKRCHSARPTHPRLGASSAVERRQRRAAGVGRRSRLARAEARPPRHLRAPRAPSAATGRATSFSTTPSTISRKCGSTMSRPAAASPRAR